MAGRLPQQQQQLPQLSQQQHQSQQVSQQLPQPQQQSQQTPQQLNPSQRQSPQPQQLDNLQRQTPSQNQIRASQYNVDQFRIQQNNPNQNTSVSPITWAPSPSSSVLSVSDSNSSFPSQRPPSQGPSGSPGNLATNVPSNSPFTSEQMILLKNQMVAFKSLSRSKPVPPSVQEAIFKPFTVAVDHSIPQQTLPQPIPVPQSILQSSMPAHSQFQAVPKSSSPDPQVRPYSPKVVTKMSPSSGPRKSRTPSGSSAGGAGSKRSSHSGTNFIPFSGGSGGSPSASHPTSVSTSPVTVASSQVSIPPPAPPAPPPPPTAYQILGISGSIDPHSYLPLTITFSDYCRRQSELIPSLFPVGVDPVKMKVNREIEIARRISSRIKLLEEETKEWVGKEHLLKDDSEDLDKVIELKSLQLINSQKALRGDLLSTTYYINSVSLDESNKHHFTRVRTQSLREAALTEQFDFEQRMERKRRENQQKLDHLERICSHARTIHDAGTIKNTHRAKLGRSVLSFHSYTEKEEQKRAERTAKQRLQALKANDEEAYIKLLDQTKDTRITHLLRQTNSFLDSLAQAVKNQQRETQAIEAGQGFEKQNEVQPELSENDEEKIDYYAVAHKIQEPIYKQPSILVGGTLKEYQIKGLQWMVSLFNNNLNGILADEMGLGKTIQSISLITYLIEAKKHPGPYLVIVPLSTLTNWTMEFEKWAPSVVKVVYKGPPLARKAQQAIIKSGNFQVLLTTYEYVIKDRPILSRIKWVHMIIDEGHRMKNAHSKLSSTLTQYYSSRYRLILTGTPLQNNLPELWALLNFVLPKIFNSVKSFDEWFNTPFANTGGQDKMDLSEEETLLIIRRLHKVLRPFLLRRLKKDVEKDLPDKIEKVIKCKMSALQAKLYQQMIRHKMLFIGENAQGATAQGLKGLNNQIMQLRKICNHPFVFEEVENLINPTKQTDDYLWRTAGKFELLDRVLPKFKASGHRVLIFFQMTQIMDIMEDFLRLRGLQYLRLDGSTKAEDRSELLKLFNAPNSPYFAFLLSTRAGGLGLNLQTADTVIIYDTDWNPHQDLQAQDRAHRIGQTREVRILRLITEDSVEENILERAHQKLDIDGKVIQAGKFDNKSTSEEQEAFLRSLLEQEEAKRGHKDEDDDEMDDDELNEILARNDAEQVLFKNMDKERHANSPYGKGKGKIHDRLFGEDELPDVYKQDIMVLLKPDPIENFGRGARERKVTHYDDGLTEEQWLDAIDNDEDSIEEAIARKRARIQKRKDKKIRYKGSSRSPSSGLDQTGSPASESSPGTSGNFRSRASSRAPSSSSTAPAPFAAPVTPLPIKRKRGRKPKAQIEAAAAAAVAANTASTTAGSSASSSSEVLANALPNAIPGSLLPAIPLRKRAKGRPPKIKETLSPEGRADLVNKMLAIYTYLQGIKEDEGRSRIDIFLELPSKRFYPDYYMLIANPIACDIIHKRIGNNTYQSLLEFLADFQLMFDNARRYNEEGSLVYSDATELEKCLVNKLAEIDPTIEYKPARSQSSNGEAVKDETKIKNDTSTILESDHLRLNDESVLDKNDDMKATDSIDQLSSSKTQEQNKEPADEEKNLQPTLDLPVVPLSPHSLHDTPVAENGHLSEQEPQNDNDTHDLRIDTSPLLNSRDFDDYDADYKYGSDNDFKADLTMMDEDFDHINTN